MRLGVAVPLCLLISVRSARGAPTEVPRPTLAQLKDARARLADFVDQRRGVTRIRATDASTDEDPSRWSEHLCEAELTAALPELEKSFRETSSGEPPVCSKRECSTGGWEYGPTASYRFKEMNGRLLLYAVVLTSVGINERRQESERRYVRRELIRLVGRSCSRERR